MGDQPTGKGSVAGQKALQRLHVLGGQIRKLLAVARLESPHLVEHRFLIALEELLQRCQQLFVGIEPLVFVGGQLVEQIVVAFLAQQIGPLSPWLQLCEEGIVAGLGCQLAQLLGFIGHRHPQGFAAAAGVGATAGHAEQILVEALERLDGTGVELLLLAHAHPTEAAAVGQRLDHLDAAEQVLFAQLQLAEPIQPGDEGEGGPVAPAIGLSLEMVNQRFCAQPLGLVFAPFYFHQYLLLGF